MRDTEGLRRYLSGGWGCPTRMEELIILPYVALLLPPFNCLYLLLNKIREITANDICNYAITVEVERSPCSSLHSTSVFCEQPL